MQSKAIAGPTQLGTGNELGFEQAALAELEVLYRVARRLTQDEAWAEDVVGQTFLQAAKGWHGFDGRFPRSWFIRILLNVYRGDVARVAARPTSVPLNDNEAGSCHVCEEVLSKLMGERLYAELDKLPEEYRLAVALCDVECLSYEEAGRAMDVPEGTVKSRLWRGRQLLRQRLRGLTDQL